MTAMTTKTAPKVATPAQQKSALPKALTDLTLLVDAYHVADKAEVAGKDAIKLARQQWAVAQTLKARNAYRVATHADVLTPRTKKAGINATGAAEKLDVKRVGLLPYIEAGRVLHDNDEWAVSVGQPTDDEVKTATKIIREQSNKARETAKAKDKGNAEQGGADTGITGDEPVNDTTAPTFDEVMAKANSLLATAKVVKDAGVDCTADQWGRFLQIMQDVQDTVQPGE